MRQRPGDGYGGGAAVSSRRPALLGIILALSPVLAMASEDGGQPFAFSKLAVGARPAAMGMAYGAVGGDAYGLPSNPALLATLRDLRIGSQWASLATERSQQYLAFGRPFDDADGSAYGLSFDRSALDAPIQKRRANTPEPDSTFGESANIFTVGVAGWLWPKRAAFGLSFKVLSQNLGEANGSGFSGDLGFFMRTSPWLDLGFSFQDIASHISWNTGAGEELPLEMRGSAAVHLFGERLLLSSDVEKSRVQDLRLRAGAELWLLPKTLAVRTGWNQGQWALGAGWRLPLFDDSSDGGVDFGLDYALAADPLGEGALQHRVSLDLGMSLK
jgi:hypothetical protein